MAISPPQLISGLSAPITINNFVALQSAKLAVTASSSSITFTNIPSSGRVTFKITNTGTKGAYITGAKTTATAVASTGSVQPSSGTNAVSNCDYVAAGTIQCLDFLLATDTIAAICGGADSTTLEISIGYGA